MIDWTECLRYYVKYIKQSFKPYTNKYWCEWYQNKLRYYNEE